MSFIGVTQRVTVNPDTKEKRDALAHDWYYFLEAAGIDWLTIPNYDKGVLKFLESVKVSGILLTGGDDIGFFPERDITENLILNWAIDKSIPIIGVCRGCQMINTFFGGTLETINGKEHVAIRHTIASSVWGEREVNSYHNQTIGNPADGLKILARSKSDDRIEAVSRGKAIGIMWHPEREKNYCKYDIELFQNYFIKGEYI